MTAPHDRLRAAAHPEGRAPSDDRGLDLETRLRRDAATRRAGPAPDLVERVRVACLDAPGVTRDAAPARTAPVTRGAFGLRAWPRIAAAAALLVLVAGGFAWQLGLFADHGSGNPTTLTATLTAGEPAALGATPPATVTSIWIDVAPASDPDRGPSARIDPVAAAEIRHLLRGDGEPSLVWQHLLEAVPGPVLAPHVDQPLLAEARGLGRDASGALAMFAERVTSPLRLLQGLLGRH